MRDIYTAQELKERIDNNDNRSTAKPYLLLLQTMKEVNVSEDGYYDETKWVEHVSGDYLRFDTKKDAKEWLKENEYENKPGSIEQYSYQKHYDTQNVFLTDKGYRDHLDVNAHNLGEHRTFGIHAWRNKEVRSLFALINENIKLQNQLKEAERLINEINDEAVGIFGVRERCFEYISKYMNKNGEA